MRIKNKINYTRGEFNPNSVAVPIISERYFAFIFGGICGLFLVEVIKFK